ncbi:MAG: hypothetical protein ACLTG0_10535 [Oscillibacter sp.]
MTIINKSSSKETKQNKKQETTEKITEYGRRLFMVKKKLLSVALVAVTVCSMIFTGCGNSAENTGNDTGKTDSDAQAGNTAGDVADDADDGNRKRLRLW